jgi:hypothetical protein
MLGKIKRYDSNLSHILQTFQVSSRSDFWPIFRLISLEANLLLDVRLAQIAQGHEVCVFHAVPLRSLQSIAPPHSIFLPVLKRSPLAPISRRFLFMLT